MLDLLPEKILADNIDFETFLRDYQDIPAEWVNGVVIEMSPSTSGHNQLSAFLVTLFGAYLEKTGEGQFRHEKFVMRLPNVPSGREPDLLVVTTPHLDRLQDTVLVGAADLVIEIVSTESVLRDRGIKFQEYETGGVREYWIIDPLHEETLFYVLDEQGKYKPNPPDTTGIYQSAVLPHFKLEAAILLEQPAPGILRAIEIVHAMLA